MSHDDSYACPGCGKIHDDDVLECTSCGTVFEDRIEEKLYQSDDAEKTKELVIESASLQELELMRRLKLITEEDYVKRRNYIIYSDKKDAQGTKDKGVNRYNRLRSMKIEMMIILGASFFAMAVIFMSLSMDMLDTHHDATSVFIGMMTLITGTWIGFTSKDMKGAVIAGATIALLGTLISLTIIQPGSLSMEKYASFALMMGILGGFTAALTELFTYHKLYYVDHVCYRCGEKNIDINKYERCPKCHREFTKDSVASKEERMV